MPLKGSRSLRRKLRRMDSNLDDNVDASVERSSAQAASIAKANVIENDAVASTELFRGIGYRSRGNRTIIHSDAGHSGMVEFGTGPKHIINPYTERYETPDLSAELVSNLVKWAVQKPTLNPQNPNAFGWKVARTISGNTEAPGGTAPQPFFVPAWNETKPLMLSRVERSVSKTVKHS